MDEEGFIPVAVFASFNKVAKVSNVPRVIQEVGIFHGCLTSRI